TIHSNVSLPIAPSSVPFRFNPSKLDGSALRRAIASSPVIPGKARSMMIRSGCVAWACSIASSPVVASTIS
ncbi:MAG TPA: hypothetical protein VM260_16835, partial [Pirellula sp.]|nr:hypothetical protein [Pirellula sp.]